MRCGWLEAFDIQLIRCTRFKETVRLTCKVFAIFRFVFVLHISNKIDILHSVYMKLLRLLRCEYHRRWRRNSREARLPCDDDYICRLFSVQHEQIGLSKNVISRRLSKYFHYNVCVFLPDFGIPVRLIRLEKFSNTKCIFKSSFAKSHRF